MSAVGLLELSRALHEAATLGDVMDVVVASVCAHTRYQRAWLLLPIQGGTGVEVIGYALADRIRVETRMASLDWKKDRYLARMVTASEPFVIDDMRECPDADQAQVEYFGNRTTINIPMLRVDERVGILAVGTFAAEGVMPPTPEELAFIVQAGALVSVVAGRLRAETAQRELEEKLQGAQRLEALGRMAGEVAHDFNNIVLSILGNAELAMARLGDTPARKYLDEIQLAGTRAAGLTRQLLAFSRGQPLAQRDLDVESVVRGVMPMLRTLLPASIALEVDVVGALGTVFADAGQIEQALMNLVINARDALSNGGKISVELERVQIEASHAGELPQSRPGDFVRVTVTDDGVGMSPEISRRVFEPFFTTKEPGVGTGLGLAVVDSVVRRHDGFLHVWSEVGRGTTFRAYFPASDRDAEPLTPPAPSHDDGRARLSECVVVADDDAQVRGVLEQVLSGAGYRVLLAVDGRAALDLVEANPHVDLVVADLVMPRMGGQVLEEILQARAGAPPVLLLTGYARGVFAQRSFAHLLTKPFAPADLLRKVRRVIDGRTKAAS